MMMRRTGHIRGDVSQSIPCAASFATFVDVACDSGRLLNLGQGSGVPRFTKSSIRTPIYPFEHFLMRGG